MQNAMASPLSGEQEALRPLWNQKNANDTAVSPQAGNRAVRKASALGNTRKGVIDMNRLNNTLVVPSLVSSAVSDKSRRADKSKFGSENPPAEFRTWLHTSRDRDERERTHTEAKLVWHSVIR